MSERTAFIAESANYARLATEAALLLNGGALVAVPAFVEVVTQPPIKMPIFIALAALCHVVGLGLAVYATFLGFEHFRGMQEATLGNEQEKQAARTSAGDVLRKGKGTVVVSFGFFALGTIGAFITIISL